VAEFSYILPTLALPNRFKRSITD